MAGLCSAHRYDKVPGCPACSATLVESALSPDSPLYRLPVLSLRQPWAWLVVTGVKDIENRSWATGLRGRVLIHAAKGCTRREWQGAIQQAGTIAPALLRGMPGLAAIERGGIIGSVEIVDCVTASDSAWFSGPYGFVLANPQPLPFHPCRGRLGFFHLAPSPGAPAVREADGEPDP